MSIIIFFLLIYISYYDLRFKEIPLEVLAISTLLLFPFSIRDIGIQLMCAVIVFGIYLLLAAFYQGGGGDVILMSCMALLIGKGIFHIMFVSHVLFLFCALYIRLRRKKETGIPFAPFVLLGYSIIIFL